MLQSYEGKLGELGTTLESYGELRKLHNLIANEEKWLTGYLQAPICIENCGRCCFQTPTVHSIEANYIISYLIGMGGLQVIDWSRGWLLEKHKVAPTYEGVPHGVVNHNITLEWNALAQTPCILLTTDKRCFVHKFRPLHCHAWGVLKRPAEYCPRPLGKGESEINRVYVGGERALVLMKVTEEFKKRLKERNPDWVQMGFLPTMIFRQAREREFREMIADNKIASAKLVGTDYSVQSLFQSQVDLEMKLRTSESVNLLKA